MSLLFFFTIAVMLFLGGINVQVSLGISELPLSIFTILMTICYLLGYKGKYTSHKAEYYTVFILLFYFVVWKYLLHMQVGLRNLFSYILPAFCVVFATENARTLIRHKKAYLYIVIFFFLVECLVAISERVTLHRLFPNLGFETGFDEFSEGFRSYAIFGHPLANASIVILTMNLILVSNFFKSRGKIALWVLGFMALLCFNGRLSIFLSIVCFFVFMFKTFFNRKSSFFAKVVLVVGVIIVGLFLSRLVASGWGDRIFLSADSDNGSIDARLDIFDIFEYTTFSTREILFGINSNIIENAQANMGAADMIIENPWILLLFRFGLIILVALIFCYIFVFAKIFKGFGLYRTLFVLAPWLAVISSSNSIAIGGTGITILLILSFIFKINDNNILIK